MLEVLNNLFLTKQFIPHGHCYLWQTGLVSLHVISDLLIALAYYSIPITLVFFVRKKGDFPFDWIFLLFATFIVACGTNHVLEVWTLWYPTYWLSGCLKALTAAVSIYTALELIPLIPHLLALPSPAKLEETNCKLAQEINIRVVAEAALLESQQMLQLVMDNIPQTIFWKDKDSVYLGCNHSFAFDAGLQTPLDIVGKTDYDLPWRQEEADSYRRYDAQVMETNTPKYHLVEPQLQADGKQVWIDTSKIPLHDAEGNVVGVLGTYEDITERLQAEQLLLQRSRLTALEADVGIALTQSHTLEEMLQQCTLAQVRHLDAALSRIWTLNSDENVLELRASAGMYTHINGQHSRIPLGQFKIGLIAQERRPHLTNRVTDDPRIQDQEWVKQERLVAFAGYPLIVEHRVVGVMAMFARQPLSEETIKAMASVANAIGLGIQRKRAEEALLKAKAELEIRVIERTAELAKANLELLNENTERLRIEQSLQESQRRLNNLINSLPGIVFSCGNDPGWSPTYLSNGCYALTGYKSEELIVNGTTPYNSITHPEDLPKVLQRINAAIDNKQPYVIEYRIRTRSGQLKWLWEKGYRVLDSDGAVLGLEGFITDITELKHTEAALQESETRYALAVQGANDGLWDWNLKTNEVYFSPRWKSMLGYCENHLKNSLCEWFNRIHPEDIERVKVALAAHLDGQTPHFQHEHRMLYQDGTYRWMLCRGLAVRHDMDGKAYRIAGSQTDITARKRAEEQLLHDAFHDALTGLPNRVLFMERLERALVRAKRQGELCAVLFLDLDRFKFVNDSLGHMMGDELLIRLAQRLSICLRATDTLARLGGDEFTILLEDIEALSEAQLVAERIQAQLTLPFTLDGQEVFATASIGIAMNATGYDKPEELLRDADTAMYQAKELGKACYAVFNTNMYTKALARMQLETDLRRAIERQEFRVYYQPIVALTSGEISGFEALVRWQHPERGLVAPSEFIPVAEENGLIVPIGYWVLRSACQQMQDWLTLFGANSAKKISVNLSFKQFSQPDLIPQITQILRETHLDASCLILEITESIIMENGDEAIAALSQLQNLGIELSIDDFGTGYSSLGRLHSFPISGLKIDRSFVSSIGDSPKNLEIIETIITLAHKLGVEVTAEGVETAEQLAQLRGLSCKYGQGYFFAPPLDSGAATILNKKGRRQRAEGRREEFGWGIQTPPNKCN